MCNVESGFDCDNGTATGCHRRSLKAVKYGYGILNFSLIYDRRINSIYDMKILLRNVETSLTLMVRRLFAIWNQGYEL